MQRFLTILIISILCFSCGKNKTQKSDGTTSSQSDKITSFGNPDTIKQDYYSEMVIFNNVIPKKKKYKYPDGKTPVEEGNTNQFIKRSFFVEKPTLEKIREIFNFYRLFYSKHAISENKELTLDFWFFDKRVPESVANPDNLDSDPKYEKNIICVFQYNFKNEYYVENCGSYEKLGNHFYKSK